jgi:transposase
MVFAASPDFNPIENAWSKIKSILRKLKARTFDDLKSALSIALNSFLNDILGWLKHCGYSAIS